jgi:hypothetical protein
MTLMEKRLAVAEALSTVDGVTGYEFPPNPAKEGDGWYYQGGLLVDQRAGLMVKSFTVVVLTPQGDERAASVFFDDHWEAIGDALQEQGYLDRVDLIAMGTQWAMSFSLRSE